MPTGIHYAANLTTSAFEEGPNTTSLWTLTQPDPLTVSDTEKIFYTIIPVLILLTITAVCFLLYRKTQTARTKLTTNL
jgi:cell division protein FtsL